MMITAIDPLTGETFYKKRSNQKFATRKNQIQFNNIKSKAKRDLKSQVDSKLENNRNILIHLLNDQEEVIKSKEYLLGAGFFFGCQTHTISRDGNFLTCIYDYAIIKIKNGNYKIVKHV